MRSVSDFIASTGHPGEPKPVGPFGVTVFIVVLTVSIVGAAWFIGQSLADHPSPTAEASANFE